MPNQLGMLDKKILVGNPDKLFLTNIGWGNILPIDL